MTFLEKNLEDIVFDAMQNSLTWESLNGRGLYYDKPCISKRQFHIGNYGTCDIITLNKPQIIIDEEAGNYIPDPYYKITIYELKQNTINLDALIQINRYMKGVNQWLSKFKKSFKNYQIEGVLIGRDIDTNHDYVYLFEHFRSTDGDNFGQISAYTYDYKFDGIYFNSIDLTEYSLVNEGF